MPVVVQRIKEAPSSEGASLVSAAPPSGSGRGGVLVTVGVWLTGESRHIELEIRLDMKSAITGLLSQRPT